MTEKQKIKDAVFFTLVFLFITWAVFLLDEYLGFHLKQYGMRPREWKGLQGVFTMHFLHGSWKHLWGNTLSFVVLTTMLFYFYRSIAFKTFVYIALAGSILLWLGGRPNNHIGASLIIFGEAFFLFAAGMFSKNPKLLRIGLVVAFYYGSMVWYLFPVDPQVSWEGHTAGALAGVFLAWRYRDQTPQRSKTRWEVEEDLEKQWMNLRDDQIVIRQPIEVTPLGEIVYRLPAKIPQISDQPNITYHYKKKNEG